MRKVRHRGLEKVGWVFTFAAAAYKMVRLEESVADENSSRRQRLRRCCLHTEIAAKTPA